MPFTKGPVTAGPFTLLGSGIRGRRGAPTSDEEQGEQCCAERESTHARRDDEASHHDGRDNEPGDEPDRCRCEAGHREIRSAIAIPMIAITMIRTITASSVTCRSRKSAARSHDAQGAGS